MGSDLHGAVLHRQRKSRIRAATRDSPSNANRVTRPCTAQTSAPRRSATSGLLFILEANAVNGRSHAVLVVRHSDSGSGSRGTEGKRASTANKGTGVKCAREKKHVLRAGRGSLIYHTGNRMRLQAPRGRVGGTQREAWAPSRAEAPFAAAGGMDPSRPTAETGDELYGSRPREELITCGISILGIEIGAADDILSGRALVEVAEGGETCRRGWPRAMTA